MNNFDYILDRDLDEYNERLDRAEYEYEETRELVIEAMRYDEVIKFKDAQGVTHRFDNGSNETFYEKVLDRQIELLKALAKADDKAVLRIVYAAFEEEVEEIVKHIQEGK
jgi:DNA-binding transcriptional MocR family regulator